MKKNALAVYAILLFIAAPVIGFCEGKNLIGKGDSFETKGIKMKLYIRTPESSQFPERPEINAVSAALEIDSTMSFDGSRSLKIPFSPFRQLKSGWLPIKNRTGLFTFSCYLCADTPNTQATLRMSPFNKKAFQQDFLLDASWKRYSITANFTDIPGPSLCCQLFFDRKKGTVWVDAIQFEEGDLKPFTASQSVELALSTEKTNNIFLTEENVRVKMETYSKEISTAGQLCYTVSDWKEEEILSGKKEITIKQKETVNNLLDLGPLPRGWYNIQIALKTGSSQKTVATGQIFLCVINPLASTDSFFGLHDHSFHKQYGATLDRLGCGWQRVFTSFFWTYIEPSMGRWRFPDRQVEEIKKHNQQILGVLQWDTANIKKAEDAVPLWGNFVWSQGGSWKTKRPIPANLDKWAEYVFKTVEHFKGKIDYWEVINEPNGWMSADEYLPLLKTAYEAAKRANPSCTVVGICTTADQGINPFVFAKEVIEKGGLTYCDVVSYHPYSRNPEETIEWTLTLKKLISQYSKGKNIPLWNTESGWSSPSCYEDMRFNPRAKNNIRTGLSPTDAANYLVRMHIIMKSLGVEKFFYFNGWTKDLGIGIYSEGDTANLINFDDSPAPALPAYNAMIDILKGTNFVRMYETGDGFTKVYLFASDTKSIAVAWSRKEKGEISLPANTMDMQVCDIMANRINADKKELDRITFILEDTPIYIIAPFSEKEKLERAIEQQIPTVSYP